MLGCFFTFLPTSRLKIVQFAFRKKLLEGGNVLLKTTVAANAHGRLLGVLRYFKYKRGAIVVQNRYRTSADFGSAVQVQRKSILRWYHLNGTALLWD